MRYSLILQNSCGMGIPARPNVPHKDEIWCIFRAYLKASHTLQLIIQSKIEISLEKLEIVRVELGYLRFYQRD